MKRVGIIIVLFILISISSETFAQCAMCQATVESNLDNGLNSGIMYLLAAPYLAMLGIGYLWYKKYRKKDVTIEIKSERINLN